MSMEIDLGAFKSYESNSVFNTSRRLSNEMVTAKKL